MLLMPGMTIATPNGEVRMPIPAVGYAAGTIYVQALFGTTNSGYAPGSFSNVLVF